MLEVIYEVFPAKDGGTTCDAICRSVYLNKELKLFSYAYVPKGHVSLTVCQEILKQYYNQYRG